MSEVRETNAEDRARIGFCRNVNDWFLLSI